MEFAYYPGCSLHVMSSEYDVAMRVTFEKLGLVLHDIPKWFCCGASSAHMTDSFLSDALSAKNLALAHQVAEQVVVPCAACFHRLGVTNNRLKENSELCASINEKISEQYHGEVIVKHPLQVIMEIPAEELAAKVVKPLKGLKVASYYGCLLLRPAQIAIDDQENPSIMEELVKTLGAAAVDWSFKTECCGGGMTLGHKETIIGLGRRVVQNALQHEADCIMVACPMCHVNLDIYQDQMKLDGELPILYFSELLGLALGIEYNKMDIERHVIAANPLLKNLELI